VKEHTVKVATNPTALTHSRSGAMVDTLAAEREVGWKKAAAKYNS